MPRPQAKSSSGSAPANASGAASPTLVSSAEETTHGSPAASATCSERRTPPNGVHLITAISAAPATATSTGSGVLPEVEVVFDHVQGVGCFVEFEFTGDADNVQDATARLDEFIASLDVELGEPVNRGYPHILLGREH